MAYYFLALGIALVGGSLALLWRRLRFLRRAKAVQGIVLRVRRMSYREQGDGGPSMHLEIRYVDKQGETRTHIADNSLLAFVYRAGQPVELAISGDKVLVNSALNIVTPPLALLLLGAVSLFVYSLKD
ncbi:MAG: DUF3592 domain-containing protein [Sedimenticolaceae bacterium]|jgi:hypothetical protein